jgi:RNA polymerase sigma-70 factor, ECF subfamily
MAEMETGKRRVNALGVEQFNALVATHYKAAYVVAFAQLRSRDLAEDATQEAFLRAYLSLEQLKDTQRFAAWVCRIARNIAIDWQRSPANARQRTISADLEREVSQMPDAKASNARDAALAAESRRQLDAVMEKLSPETREVLLLHHAEGLSYREIGDRLNIHPTTVRYRLGRAVTESRKLLSNAAALASGLAPRPSAAARVTGLVAAVGAVSAGSREALAAKALSLTAPLTATMSATGSPAAITKAASLAAYAGGLVMGAKQIAVAAVAVAAIGGGGVAYMASSGENGIETQQIARPIDTAPGKRVFGDITIAPSTAASTPGRLGSVMGDKVVFTSVTPAEVLTFTNRSRSYLTEIAADVPDLRIDVEYPSSTNTGLVSDAVCSLYGLKVTDVLRDRDMFVVTAPNGRPAMLRKPKVLGSSVNMSVSSSGEIMKVECHDMHIGQMISLMEETLKTPIDNKTGITYSEKFDYDFSFNKHGTAEEITETLRKMGFELKPVRQPVKTLLIEKLPGGGATGQQQQFAGGAAEVRSLTPGFSASTTPNK